MTCILHVDSLLLRPVCTQDARARARRSETAALYSDRDLRYAHDTGWTEMRVLTFTSLFPNNMRPHHGVFVKERALRIASQLEGQLRVIAPVPTILRRPLGCRRHYSQVASCETIEGS